VEALAGALGCYLRGVGAGTHRSHSRGGGGRKFR
jgi:hypothetical protein